MVEKTFKRLPYDNSHCNQLILEHYLHLINKGRVNRNLCGIVVNDNNYGIETC